MILRCIRPMMMALALAAPTVLAAQEPPKSHRLEPYDTRVANWVTPALQSWTAGDGQFRLTDASRIIIPKDNARLKEIAGQLAAGLQPISGLRPAILSAKPRAGDIVLELAELELPSQSPEAYSLEIGGQAKLRARSEQGVFYATQSLLQLLKHDRAGRIVPAGVATDWPDTPQRAMMVDIGRRYMEMDQLERLMRDMAWLKMNTLALHFTDWPAFRLRSEKYPGLADRQSYDRKDIQRLEAYARKHGITIIPEIDLPAHATAIIRYKPSLAFTCPSMRQSEWLTRASPDDTSNMAWTVDITRAENRAWLAGLLDEFIPWFSGPWFHIGGDEYQYDADKTRCPELMDYTRQRGFEHPGDVFVDWINETNRQVKKHGKTTAIWNWWRFRDDKTSIEPDKDILVYVWNRPREKDIIDSGYSVILTPEDRLYVSAGIENFDGSGYGVVDTRFVYEKMPLDRNPKVLGYMVALWTDAAENRTDTYLLGKAHEPMAVLAERLWSDQSSESLNAFLARLNKSSQAPVGELPQPR